MKVSLFCNNFWYICKLLPAERPAGIFYGIFVPLPL